MPRNWKTNRGQRRAKRAVSRENIVADRPRPWWAQPNPKREKEERELRQLRERRRRKRMECERCHNTPEGFKLHDYCAECGKNLCEDCMEKGCCGNTPATSGMKEAEETEAAEQLQEEGAEQLKDKDFTVDSDLSSTEGQQGEIGQ